MTGTVVATGFFDGVHLGHRHLVQTLTDEARRRSAQSLIVTFWPHPRNVLQDGARELRLLTSLPEKRELLCSLGVDRVEVLDFTRDFSALTMREYISQVLVGRFGAQCLVLGYDNRMGSDCRDTAGLAAVARESGLDVVLTDSVSVPVPVPAGQTGSASSSPAGSAGTGLSAAAISSTRIRTALAEGRVEDAAAMLGRPYNLHGVVVAGNRLGRTIGFPTANMQLYEPLKAIPAPGVYAVRVRIPSCAAGASSVSASGSGSVSAGDGWVSARSGGSFLGMCNIGYRPTVGPGNALTIETHILDFDENIYGLDLHLSFLSHIRPERKFDSLQALAAQLAADKLAVRSLPASVSAK